jgi:serine/threonine-protein kinase
MPPLLVVRVVKEVASALSYVHAQKIYHRDLKPQNVMLDMACQPYRSLLIDFGLVSEQQAGGVDKDKGLIMGTPNYMPPEQAAPKGGFGEVDQSSDIYSLGATMYYLLTGEPPFTGRDPRLIIKQVVSEKPRDPCEVNKSIPRRIGDICLKCLEKRQADRFPTSRALEAELDKELRSGQRSLKAKAFLGKLLGRPRDGKDGK